MHLSQKDLIHVRSNGYRAGFLGLRNFKRVSTPPFFPDLVAASSYNWPLSSSIGRSRRMRISYQNKTLSFEICLNKSQLQKRYWTYTVSFLTKVWIAWLLKLCMCFATIFLSANRTGGGDFDLGDTKSEKGILLQNNFSSEIHFSNKLFGIKRCARN